MIVVRFERRQSSIGIRNFFSNSFEGISTMSSVIWEKYDGMLLEIEILGNLG